MIGHRVAATGEWPRYRTYRCGFEAGTPSAQTSLLASQTIHKASAEPQSLAEWRESADNEPPPIYAAAVKGQFQKVMESIDKAGERLTPEDYLMRHGDAPPIIEQIANRTPHLLTKIFEPERWVGDPMGMRRVYEAVPDSHQNTINFDALRMQVNAVSAKSWVTRAKNLPDERRGGIT